MNTIRQLKREALLYYRHGSDFCFSQRKIRTSKYAAPDFFITGVSKSGTTMLFISLAKHPQLMPACAKELRFLGYEIYTKGKGLDWYLSQFPKKEKAQGRLTFEGTPSYFHTPQVPKQMYRLFPKAKFIVIFRDPVQRAYSNWNHVAHRAGKNKRTFREAVHQELEGKTYINISRRYIAKGLYAKHLQHWYDIFPREQILVLDFDDLKEHPQQLWQGVTGFLNVKNILNETIDNQAKAANKRQQHNNTKTMNNSKYKSEMDKATKDTYLPNIIFNLIKI